MKKVILFIGLASVLFFEACTSPMNGVLFTSTSHYVTQNGTQIGSGKVLKSGKSCSVSGFLVNIFFYGAGGSIEEAKANGGITKIAVVDYTSLNIFLSLFYRECVVVWGE